MQTIIIVSRLEFIISTKHVGYCRIVADKKKFGGIESVCLFVRSVEPCHGQLVGAAAHHLLGI